MKFANRFLRFVVDLFSQPYSAVFVEDLPEALEGRTLYLVGEGKPWSAGLLCPCGCKETIQLSLVANDNPRWKLTHHRDDSFSLHPSIWRTKNCESHFFLRRGRISWARELRPRGVRK
jgi:hypothetical protein